MWVAAPEVHLMHHLAYFATLAACLVGAGWLEVGMRTRVARRWRRVAATGLPGELQLTVKFTAEPGAPATQTGAIRLRCTDPDRPEVLVTVSAAINRAPVAVIAPVGNAAPGMLVTLRPLDDDDPEDETYLLAHSPEERAPGVRTITTNSPLGATIAGRRIGDEITYRAPGGEFRYEVVALEPHP